MLEKELKNKIVESLQCNYNFPMVESIEVKYDQTRDIYIARLMLKESFEFYFENGATSNELVCEIPNALHLNISEFNSALYGAGIKDRYAYRCLKNMSQSEFNSQYIKLAEKFFSKSIYELTKQESSIVFNYINFLKYNNSNEIVEDFNDFYEEKGRFPYKNEWLYKVLENAKKTGFINEEDLNKINSLASTFAFNKLCDFIEQNKRWPYPSEQEYVRSWNEVCFNFVNGNYNSDQLLKLEILYARFNNEKDSIGERLINSYIVSLGYNVEKSFAFLHYIPN